MVDSVQGLRPDGRLVTMGADAEPLAVSLMDLIGKRIQVIGSTQNGREYLYEALDFAAKGKVKVMAETYLLADAPKAYQRVAEGKPRFRRYPLARHRAPRNPIAGAWRWTRPMAGRIDPVPRRRKRRFRSGGLRCQGSSGSSFRPGPRIGSERYWAAARFKPHIATNRSSQTSERRSRGVMGPVWAAAVHPGTLDGWRRSALSLAPG
jgi:hypothetical protein